MNLIIKVDRGSDLTFPELPSVIHDCECADIINKYGEVTEEAVGKTVDMLIARFNQKHLSEMIVNIPMRNDANKPVVEMTIKDIEEKLGYKVKIVADGSNQK